MATGGRAAEARTDGLVKAAAAEIHERRWMMRSRRSPRSQKPSGRRGSSICRRRSTNCSNNWRLSGASDLIPRCMALNSHSRLVLVRRDFTHGRDERGLRAPSSNKRIRRIKPSFPKPRRSTTVFA